MSNFRFKFDAWASVVLAFITSFILYFIYLILSKDKKTNFDLNSSSSIRYIISNNVEWVLLIEFLLILFETMYAISNFNFQKMQSKTEETSHKKKYGQKKR